MAIQMACNPTRQPCGCTAWDQLESGRWVRRYWLCNRHEIAATREAA
jgi:hypothetical protein